MAQAKPGWTRGSAPKRAAVVTHPRWRLTRLVSPWYARDGGQTVDPALAHLDRRAERILQGLAPLRVERARPEEIEATQRMRWDCAVGMGWRPPEGVAGGRERDDHDAGAIVLVCRDGAAIAGCLRVVPPEPGRLLPTERDFGVRVRPPGSAGDVGRLAVVARAPRGHGPAGAGGPVPAAWLERRALGLVAGDRRGAGADDRRLPHDGPHRGRARPADAALGGGAHPAGGLRRGGQPRLRRAGRRRRRARGGPLVHPQAVLSSGAARPGPCSWSACPTWPPRAAGDGGRAGRPTCATIGMIERVNQAGAPSRPRASLARVRGLPIAALSTARPEHDRHRPGGRRPRHRPVHVHRARRRSWALRSSARRSRRWPTAADRRSTSCPAAARASTTRTRSRRAGPWRRSRALPERPRARLARQRDRLAGSGPRPACRPRLHGLRPAPPPGPRRPGVDAPRLRARAAPGARGPARRSS